MTRHTSEGNGGGVNKSDRNMSGQSKIKSASSARKVTWDHKGSRLLESNYVVWVTGKY